ncbi:MAG: helix-turn-helix transcriptional regulator [Oceanospirillaceae bacterium]|nr:helix-turn-helix transcriptional regulator [Oceanospirillaceae bacterium]|tara:strand:+ start:793 stop:3477 length:2685 start_codon:yes stop_codon:yes gene_type:complete
MPLSVLPTRIHKPAPRSGYVLRERLQQRFLQGLFGRLLLVSAPAGFGKTTLVSSALAEVETPSCWLSLDSGDNDPVHLIRGLIAATQTCFPDAGHSCRLLLGGGQPADTGSLLSALLTDLSELPDDMLLVLDDYHLIESPAATEVLAFLLEHQPAGVHWLITTREDPSLPLARMRARGELQEIRADDLRFTPAEARSFFSDTMHLPLSPALIDALEARTEGWIAGLQLAALSLQNHSDPEHFVRAFTGNHRFIVDYLVEEVLRQQDNQTRTFLLQTSLLPRFTPELCNRVTGLSNSQELLHRLERQNLFLIALDEDRNWFRYHHLFADVLRNQLRQDSVDAASLHLRASQWFAEQGETEQAINHALLAGDASAAAALIEACWPEMRKSLPESRFLSWMASLPEAVTARHPVLCAYYALALLSSDPQAACRWMDITRSFTDNPQTTRGLIRNHQAWAAVPGILAISQAYYAGAQGDPSCIITHANTALAVLPQHEYTWRGAASILKGFVLWASGETSSAANAISNGYDNMQRDGEISGAISAAFLLARIRISQGRSAEAEGLCRRAVELAADFPLKPQGYADILVVRARMAINRGENERASDLLNEAWSLGEQARLQESAHLWYLAQAILAARQNRLTDAFDLLDEAQSQFMPGPAPEFEPLEAWRARFELARGNIAAAREWAQQSQLSITTAVHALNAFALRVLARLELETLRLGLPGACHAGDVLNLLQQLEQHDARPRPGHLPEILFLQALTRHCQGADTEAAALLKQAIHCPAAHEQQALFMYETAWVQDWLNATLPLCKPGEQLQQGQRLSEVTASTEATGVLPLPDPLSEREMDVLRALHSDMSGPEIAASLFVSLNTLRTHSKNIYSKLGVNTRRAALRRAAELGLTP